jgi:hypothetical protein
MQALAGQLGIPEPTINSGLQIFKLAANNNFIQGRRMDMVSAVCLYTACRKEKPCRVMLIDFADKLQVCLSFSFLLLMLTIPGQCVQAWFHLQNTPPHCHTCRRWHSARLTRGLNLSFRSEA